VGVSLRIFCVASLGALAACGGDNPPAAAIQTVELSTELQATYERSCKMCHGYSGTGAPQTGVAGDWAKRVDRGMESMLANAVDGYQGMPAMGACFSCSEADMRQLTAFMAGVKNP
jgi:cytochrome c5